MKCLVVWSCAICLVVAASTIASAQDDGAQEPPTQAGIIVAESAGDGSAQIMTFSTIPGGFSPLQLMPSNLGMSFGSPSTGAMLMDNQIQAELELVDDQLEEIRDLQRELQQKTAEAMKGIQGENGRIDVQRMREIQPMMQELREDTQARINDVLLPHQAQRLSQLRRHLQMSNQGNADFLTSDVLVEELNLSEDQIERLRERAEEIEKKLAEDIRELKQEAKEELFDELTTRQKEKLKELLGDSFIYEQPDPRRQSRQRRRDAADDDE